MKLKQGLLKFLLIFFAVMPTTAIPSNQFDSLQQDAAPTITGTLTKESIPTSTLDHLNYWLYTPENVVANMPLVVYLHGGSSKGDDLDLLMSVNGFPKYIQAGQIDNIPAYIIMPQLASRFRGWTDIQDSLSELISYVSDTYQIDPSNISLTGHSMGGTGVWGIAIASPNLFARIAPLSGSVQVTTSNVNALVGLPVWAFVGSEDTIVDPSSSIQFINQLRENNSEATITIFDGATHFDVPQLAYLDDNLDLVGWLTLGSTPTAPPVSEIYLPLVRR